MHLHTFIDAFVGQEGRGRSITYDLHTSHPNGLLHDRAPRLKRRKRTGRVVQSELCVVCKCTLLQWQLLHDSKPDGELPFFFFFQMLIPTGPAMRRVNYGSTELFHSTYRRVWRRLTFVR
jgi:hypothetical protein